MNNKEKSIKKKILAKPIQVKPTRGIDITIPEGTEIFASYYPDIHEWRILSVPSYPEYKKHHCAIRVDKSWFIKK